jgi:ribonuclease-3
LIDIAALRNTRIKFVQSAYVIFLNSENEGNPGKPVDTDELYDEDDGDRPSCSTEYFDQLWGFFSERIGEIREIISESAPAFEFKKIPAIDKAVLSLGIIEIFFVEKAPKIVINECLEISKQLKGEDTSKFINGALFKVFSRHIGLNEEEEKIFDIAHKLGFNFTKREPVVTAFVHRSALNESERYTESYDRLEFLGDSLISEIVSTYLFDNFDWNEGDLSKTKLNLVNGKTLAEVSKSTGLYSGAIISKGLDVSNTDSVAEDIFESFCAAVHIEFGEERLRSFIIKYLIEPNIDLAINDRNPKSELQNYCQQRYKITPTYKIISQDRDPITKREVFVSGVYLNDTLLSQSKANSTRVAENEAAAEAMSIVQDPEFKL